MDKLARSTPCIRPTTAVHLAAVLGLAGRRVLLIDIDGQGHATDGPGVPAASLNLIEPWWTVLRALALKGRRFERWDEVCRAVARATSCWNRHRHPFVWGRRCHHRPKRQPGIAAAPHV